MKLRKNYYIKPEFQNRFIAKFWMMLVMSSLLLAVCIYLFSTSSLTTTFENSRLVIRSTADFILPVLLFSGLMVILAVSATAIYITKRSSHSLAGPIHRFEQELKKISTGDLSVNIQLRKNDQFKELAGELNEMLGIFRDKIDQAQNDLEQNNTQDAAQTLKFFNTGKSKK